MKPISVVLFSVLVVGHVLGYYLPTHEHGSACGCGGPPVELQLDDPRYRFDFAVEQPKASDSEPELKSYSYQIQTPQDDKKSEDPKYKFDYMLQAPVEEKPVETAQRTLYTKVDRMTEDKRECSCKQGAPCTCGYSPEKYATQFSGPTPQSNAYVLPVRYNNGGDYVVYELPEEASQKYLHRTARQIPADPAAPVQPVPLFNADAIASLVNVDRIRAAGAAFRERMSQLIPSPLPASSDDSLGSTLGSTGPAPAPAPAPSSSPIDMSAIRDRFSQFADPFVTRATKIVEGFRESIANVARTRRSAETEDGRRNSEMRMPMLRVREYDESRDGNRYSKYLSTARVELKRADKQDMDLKEMEKATHCHKCGSRLTESVCSRCGEYQPQYVEYIEGKPVSFYPGATQVKREEKSSDEPRYIYDRYGHRYLENNGNLRLIAPKYQEAIVGDQPNFAGLADILSQNREVIQQLNPLPGRMMPQPVDLATDFITLIRDLGRARDAEEYRENKNEKRSTTAVENKQKRDERVQPPRSMYQVVPMRYDGKDGKLVVKVYSAKKDQTRNPEASKTNEERREQTSKKDDETNMTEKSQPTIKKYTRNNKEFEILTFDDYKNSSDEDIRRVIEHLHGKQSW